MVLRAPCVSRGTRTLLFLWTAALSTPAAAQESSWVGTNLWPIADWSTEWVFVDAFKHARDWVPQEAGSTVWDTGQPLATTAEGWPLLAPGQAAGTLLCRELDGHYPGGEYTAFWSGTGQVEFHFDAEVTTSWSHGAKMDVTPTDAGIHVKVVQSDANDPVRDIRVVMPGFETNYQTQIFHPTFLERLRGFGTLRFMDWQQTNNSTQQDWSDRPTTDLFSQATDAGVALEYMVELCNQLDADPWFCMPHLATDSYVWNFATYVRDHLEPGRRVYIEHSNEVWNPIFQQAQWANAQGNALNLSHDPFQAQVFFHSLRSVHLFDLWEQVFGGTDRLVRVMGSHSANPWIGAQALGYQNAWQETDALGIAPYFGGTLGASPQAATTIGWNVDQVLDACETHVGVVLGHIAENVANASALGVDVVAYEGGQHLVGVGSWITNPVLENLFGEANRHPRMGELYEQYLDGWEALGGAAFCAFSSCVTPSLFGHWGALEYQDQPIEEAHKYRALRVAVWESLAADPVTTCTSRPTSIGPAVALTPTGTSSIVLDDLGLEAVGAPGNYGLFFAGDGAQPVPFGEGVLCVSQPFRRLAVRPIVGGVARLELPPSADLPRPSPGDTRHVQFWFRDPAGGPQGFNLSDGLALTYTP